MEHDDDFSVFLRGCRVCQGHDGALLRQGHEAKSQHVKGEAEEDERFGGDLQMLSHGKTFCMMKDVVPDTFAVVLPLG